MTNRLRSLERIVAVQEKMVRLSEWRFANAERACRDLRTDQARLRGYVMEEGALGVALAKSALRSLDRLDARLAAAERARETNRSRLDVAKRQEQAAANLTQNVRVATRRVEDDRELARTIETWLVARGPSSLP